MIQEERTIYSKYLLQYVIVNVFNAQDGPFLQVHIKCTAPKRLYEAYKNRLSDLETELKVLANEEAVREIGSHTFTGMKKDFRPRPDYISWWGKYSLK